MLDAILLGKTRAAVLRELFLNPDRRVSFNELVRRLKTGDGAVARELKTLIGAGLVLESREGNQRFLSARKDSPVYDELSAFISKTSGVPFFVQSVPFRPAGLRRIHVHGGPSARMRKHGQGKAS